MTIKVLHSTFLAKNNYRGWQFTVDNLQFAINNSTIHLDQQLSN
jgi:hypothetical protein